MPRVNHEGEAPFIEVIETDPLGDLPDYNDPIPVCPLPIPIIFAGVFVSCLIAFFIGADPFGILWAEGGR